MTPEGEPVAASLDGQDGKAWRLPLAPLNATSLPEPYRCVRLRVHAQCCVSVGKAGCGCCRWRRSTRRRCLGLTGVLQCCLALFWA